MLMVMIAYVAHADEEDIVFAVESGTRRVKVEIQNEITGQWATHRILHLPGRASQVKIRLPERDLRRFRVLTSKSDPFPYTLYKDQKSFSKGGKKAWEAKHGVDAALPNSDARFLSTPTTPTAVADIADQGQEQADAESPAKAVESDIWKVDGNTLYFFNQNRGLQIYDLTTPWAPERVAYLRMPALGEQMYVLDDKRVVLLLRRPRQLDGIVPGDVAVQSNSEVVVVDWSGTAAQVISRTQLPGKYLESRMVGRRLYAVCNTGGYFLYRNWMFFNWEDWVSGMPGAQNRADAYLSTLDLSFPESPVIVEERALATRAREVAATGTHLLVVRDLEQSYYSTKDLVDVFQIREDAAPELLGTVQAGGRINDKFKMQVQGGILTTVSQAYRESWWGRHTLVQTFRLPEGGARTDVPLDSVMLAENETLHATRFDGTRLYVVTFRRIDPLFVVDLADPKDIQVHGELEIPGWSTYLIPRGDRLLSVGVENTQVAVSIFDVSDPANPSMADRIFLGEPGQYTYSEANWDEKAVGYFPEQDVLIVPYETWDWNAGSRAYKTAMQKIKIVGDDLQKAGEVPHEVRARRATMLGSLLASISGEALLVADLRDPDKPSIVAKERLSWPVHQVYRTGDYLLELEKSNQAGEGSVLRLVHVNEPEQVVQKLELPAGILMDVFWHPGASRLTCLIKGNHSSYLYYDNHSKQTRGLDAKRNIIIVGVDAHVPGELYLLPPAEIDLSEEFWSINQVEFFHAGLDWLGVRVKGSPPLKLVSYSWDANWYYYDQKQSQLLLALGSLPDGTFKALSRILGEHQWSSYHGNGGIVFAEDRWLFSQSAGSTPELCIYDFSDPASPELTGSLELPANLQLQAANEVVAGSAILYFTRQQYADHYGRYDDIAFVADVAYWPANGSTELFAALYDGADLYFLDGTLKDLDFDTALWQKEDFLVKESPPQSYYYPWAESAQETEESETTKVWRYALDSHGFFEKQAQWEFPGRAGRSALLAMDGKVFLADDTFLQWVDIGELGVNPQWTQVPQGPYLDFSNSWYESGEGLYVPVGQYGVEFIPVDATSTHQLGRLSSRNPLDDAWAELSKLKIQIQGLAAPGGPTISEGEDWAFQPIRSFMESGQANAVVDGQDGWYQLGSFGRYYTDYHPWVYHEKLGWLFMDESGAQDGFWAWRTAGGEGWLWTSADLYPFSYSPATASWLYFYEIPGVGLWRYDFGSGSWLSE